MHDMHKLTESDILRIAAEAECDPRTVRTYLNESTTTKYRRVHDRIKRAIDGITSGDTTRGDTGPGVKREA